MTRVTASYTAVSFQDVPGWAADQHHLAFSTFLKSCERLIVLSRTDSKAKADPSLLAVCVKAVQQAGPKNAAEARAFFEHHFTPQRVVHTGGARLLTAYYEPLVRGSRVPTARFPWPLYKRPADLVTVIDEANRGTANGRLTHVRQTAAGPVPFATRQEIEQGALKGQKLELLYVEHAVDAFFIQIQGSARVKLPDDSTVRVGYDGKNGHPYTSIGRVLIDEGQIPVERMSLQALAVWLKANSDKARQVMWANKSFVFFREHEDKTATDPHGVHDIILTPGRSLAVDPSYHALGLPIYVAAPEIRHITTQAGGFARLMIAQDVGSAIKGPERGDIYVGSGDKAGKIAGTTKHPGSFYVLLPKGASVPDGTARKTEPAKPTTVSATPRGAAPQGAPAALSSGPAVAPGPSEALPWQKQPPASAAGAAVPVPAAATATPVPVPAPATGQRPEANETIATKRAPTGDTGSSVADQLKMSQQ